MSFKDRVDQKKLENEERERQKAAAEKRLQEDIARDAQDRLDDVESLRAALTEDPSYLIDNGLSVGSHQNQLVINHQKFDITATAYGKARFQVGVRDKSPNGIVRKYPPLQHPEKYRSLEEALDVIASIVALRV